MSIIVSIQSVFGVTIFIVLPQYANNFELVLLVLGFFAANGAGIFLGTIFTFYTGILKSKILVNTFNNGMGYWANYFCIFN